MKNTIRGDISIFVVIVMSAIMLGSAVLLSLILARQISLTEDIVASERAFYAASAGIEHGFYDVARNLGKEEVVGTIPYPEEQSEATYDGTMKRPDGVTCGAVRGEFGGEQRRIQIGPDEC